MKKTILALMLFVATLSHAENPRISVLEPANLQVHTGKFVVAVENFFFQPDLAGDTRIFGNGLNALGEPIQLNRGHMHGWVFPLERNGKGKPKYSMVRDDSDFPAPNQYTRFYGAGGWEYASLGDGFGIITRTDDLKDLDKGLYQVFFALQFDDHTALQQSTAAAMQPVASVIFEVK